MTQTPSQVMINHYNSRIAKFIKYEEKDIQSWRIVRARGDKNIQVELTMVDNDTRLIELTRTDIADILTVEEGTALSLDYRNNFYQTYQNASNLIKKACHIANEDPLVNTIEFTHSVLIWTNYGTFIPPQDITIRPSIINPKLDQINYELTINSESLFYIGKLHTVVVGELQSTPPPVIEPSLMDLKQLGNSDTPGEWTITRAASPIVESEEDIQMVMDSILERLGYMDPEFTIDDIIVTKTINSEGTDFTITPSEAALNTILKGEAVLKIRAVKLIDLSKFTNTGEAGVINYDYSVVDDGVGDIDQLIINLMNVLEREHGDEYRDYNNPVYLTQLVSSPARETDPVVEDVTIVYLTPPEHANEYTMTGELKVVFNKVPASSYEGVLDLQQLSMLSRNMGTDDNGEDIPQWEIPTVFNEELEKGRILSELVTLLNINYKDFTTVAMTPTGSDELTVCFKPTLESRYHKVLGEHTLRFVVNSELEKEVVVAEQYDLSELTHLSAEEEPIRYSYHLNQEELNVAVASNTILTTLVEELNTKAATVYTMEDMSCEYQASNKTLTVKPNWGYTPCKLKGSIKVKLLITDNASLDLINLGQVKDYYHSKTTFDECMASVKHQLKMALEDTTGLHVDTTELKHSFIDDVTVGIEFIDNPTASTVLTRGVYTHTLYKEYVTDFKLNLDICTNGQELGVWNYTATAVEDITAQAETIIAAVIKDIKVNYADNDPNVNTGGLEHIVEGNDIMVSGMRANGTLIIRLSVEA